MGKSLDHNSLVEEELTRLNEAGDKSSEMNVPGIMKRISDKISGVFGRFGQWAGNSFHARVLASLLAAAPVAACEIDQGREKSPSTFSTRQLALTAGELVNENVQLPLKQYPWSQPGDGYHASSMLGGKYVIAFVRDIPGGAAGEQAMAVHADVKADLSTESVIPYPLVGTEGTGSIGTLAFDHSTGKFYFNRSGSGNEVKVADLFFNSEGKLEASNVQDMAPEITGFAAGRMNFLQDPDGKTWMFYTVGSQMVVRDPVTFEENTDFTDKYGGDCGVPSQDPNNPQGPILISMPEFNGNQAGIYKADTWGDLVNQNLTKLSNFSIGDKWNISPQQITDLSTGELHVDWQKGNGANGLLFTAKVVPPVVNPEPDPDPNDADAGSTDTNEPDTTDETDTTDTADTTGDTGSDTGTDPDVGPEDTGGTEDTGPEADSVDPTDVSEDTKEEIEDTMNPPDDTEETSPDTGEPDTTPDTTPDTSTDVGPDAGPECTTESANFEITSGNCKITVCPTEIGILNGEDINVTGDDHCEADFWVEGIDQPGKVIIDTSNGEISALFKFFEGEDPQVEPLVDGIQFHVIEEGHGMGIKQYGYTTGSAASNFSSKDLGKNGKFSELAITSYNKPEEPPVIFFNDEFIFQVPSDGRTYIVKVDTTNGTPVFPDFPDFPEPQPEAQPEQAVEAGSDLSTKPPKTGDGCETGSDSPAKSLPVALSLMVLALIRRRKQSKEEA